MCITKEEFEDIRRQAKTLLSELKERESTLSLEKKQIDAKTWIYVEKGKQAKLPVKGGASDLRLNDYVFFDDAEIPLDEEDIY